MGINCISTYSFPFFLHRNPSSRPNSELNISNHCRNRGQEKLDKAPPRPSDLMSACLRSFRDMVTICFVFCYIGNSTSSDALANCVGVSISSVSLKYLQLYPSFAN